MRITYQSKDLTVGRIEFHKLAKNQTTNMVAEKQVRVIKLVRDDKGRFEDNVFRTLNKDKIIW